MLGLLSSDTADRLAPDRRPECDFEAVLIKLAG